jgi:hypothetical protein
MFYYNHAGYEIPSYRVVFGFSQIVFINRTTVLQSFTVLQLLRLRLHISANRSHIHASSRPT